MPSEYWRSNCYAGISPFSPAQLAAGDLTSTDRDDGRVPDPQRQRDVRRRLPAPRDNLPLGDRRTRVFAAMPDVTETDVRKVLYENAADVYHLDLEALQPHFDRVGFELDEPVAAPA